LEETVDRYDGIKQYSLGQIIAVWAAAALPIGVLAWIVAPALKGDLSGAGNVPMAKALLLVLTGGLIWQGVMVAGLVWLEQRSLRWSTVREALWLRSPRSPKSGRVLWAFNTVLGEELLFRGLLLPRMNRAFGRADWLANGVLFAAYHVHVPWVMPETLLGDTLLLAYPTKRYQSAWLGIVVHSAQSVVLAAIVLTFVL
jgi:membrane protease YdiL (CAAX protease family)